MFSCQLTPYTLVSSLAGLRGVVVTTVLVVIIHGALSPLKVCADTPIPSERVSQLVEALSQNNWVEPTLSRAASAVSTQSATLQPLEQLWQGNIPRIDLKTSHIVLNWRDAQTPEPFRVTIDLSGREPIVQHSKAKMKNYRGGVLFQKKGEVVEKFYLLGTGNSSLYMFVPPYREDGELSLALCPRSLVQAGERKFALEPSANVQPEAIAMHVSARVRALVFSGSSSGFIEASLLRSSGVAEPMEPQDVARGINPVIDLVYRPRVQPQLSPFTPGAERHDYFLVHLDMRLPGGARRVIREGLQAWIVPVVFPEREVTIPISTILQTGAATGVPRELRQSSGNLALPVRFLSGACTLIITERIPRTTEYHDEKSSQASE